MLRIFSSGFSPVRIGSSSVASDSLETVLLSVLLYLIPTAVLLRKKKLPEVQLYWHQYV